MSSKWIHSTTKILQQIEKLEGMKEKDRLEHIRSILFMLNVLGRSLNGWMQWIMNPDLMTEFTKEELGDIDKRLTKFTRSFLKYDLEITEKGEEKGLKIKRKFLKSRRLTEGLYI